MFVGSATLSLVLLPVAQPARPATRDQQKCIHRLNRDFAMVVSATGKVLDRCIADHARGRLGTVDVAECLAMDRRGGIGKAKQRTEKHFDRRCAPDLPAFGTTDADTINRVAVDKELALLEVLFGSDVDAALAKAEDDPRRAKCQRKVARALRGCQDTKLAEFNRCKKTALEAGADSAAALEDCMGSDPRLRILRACRPTIGNLALTIQRECAEVDLPAAFPTCDTADPRELHSCLETRVECLVCSALNEIDDLGRNCDVFDDGQLNGSCLSGAFTAGTCLKKITPVVGQNHSDPIFIAGFDPNRTATGVHDDLWARGMVLSMGRTKIALVTLDLIGYFNNEVLAIRSLVDPALKLDRVFVTSTHTHEGPDTLGLWGPDRFTTGVDAGYLDFVNQQVADCVAEADAARVPAEIKFATGTTQGASLPPHPDLVRDTTILEPLVIDLTLIGGTGTVVVEGDPGEFTNPSLPMLQIRDLRTQDVLLTLANFASHPESLGSANRLITSDFPHFMRENLEQRYGGIAIYLSADLGVLQSPRVDLADPDDPAQLIPFRSYEFAERMGDLLAERGATALDASGDWLAAPALEVRTVAPVVLTIENPFFQLLADFGLLGRRVPGSSGEDSTFDSEVHVLRIGPAQMVLTPNELDPQIGDEYRALMTEADHRFVAGLANDELGYQMPFEKFNPSCFLCAFEVLFGNEEDCPLFSTLDCSTVFINNVGPATDPQLRGLIEGLIQNTQD